MTIENRLRGAVLIAACAALAACGGDRAAPASAMADAPAPPVAPAAPSGELARQLDAANAAFDAGRFVAPPGDNALEWFAAARESDPAHPGVVEALVDLYPVALAAAERALAEGDGAEALRIIDLLDRAQPDSLGTRLLRERLRAAQADAAPATAERPPASDAAAPTAAIVALPLPQPAAPSAAAPAAAPSATPSLPDAESQRPSPSEPPLPDSAPAPAAGDAAAPTTAALPLADAGSPPRLLSRVEPAYPQLARQRRIEGWVELEFLVGTDGTPRDIEVVASSPNAIFDAAATRALQRWRFEPARRDGAVEATRTRTRISFRLG